MSQPKAPPPGVAGPQISPVVVKKYANRRLYNTESSSYITLDNLAEMVRAGRDFVVYDAKTSDDITRSVLTQIIVEEESKGGASSSSGCAPRCRRPWARSCRQASRRSAGRTWR